MDVTDITRFGGYSAQSMREAEELPTGDRAAAEEEAFPQLFAQFARPIIAFIYDMVGERGLAEELAQETFVRAYKGLSSRRYEASLATWLYGIAKNVVREALRARARNNSRTGGDEEALRRLPDAQPTPDAQLLDKELNRAVHDALRSLDEDRRMVFTLRVFQQMSYQEIAAATGFSLAKVKSDLFRARAEMQQLIGPYLVVSK